MTVRLENYLASEQSCYAEARLVDGDVRLYLISGLHFQRLNLMFQLGHLQTPPEEMPKRQIYEVDRLIS